MKDKTKLLFLDIEVSKAEVWCYPNRQGKPMYIKKKDIKKPSEIISIAWWWEGSDNVECIGWDYDEKQKDRRIVETFIKEIPHAKAVVGHFLDGFDMPWLRYKCLTLGLEPFGGVDTIDTVRLCKPFRFYSRKLDDIAIELGIGCKNSPTDQEWDEVKQGDKNALLKIMDYNCNDVNPLLSGVYYKLNKYTQGKRTKMNENDPCTECGNNRVQKWDTRVKVSTGYRYQRYRCYDCGHITQDNRQLK